MVQDLNKFICMLIIQCIPKFPFDAYLYMKLSTCLYPVFLSTPASLNATLGSTAVFNCSATRGHIDWMVNGSLLSELGSSDVIATSRGSMFFLQVPATEEYNNTVVVCEVVIRVPLSVETSDPAVLRVQGMFCL